VPEEKITAIPHWQVSDVFSPLERAVLAYTDGLVYDGGRVPDEVFEVLRGALSDQEILELTYITTLYDMHATICRALRLEYDDRPEPIEEVQLPEGVEARDLSADLSGA
jgi:alkylhydroperoxidase family enzyme